MKFLLNIIKQIDWNIVLPIITFFVGLSYSFLDKYLERKRKVDNMRTILIQEISANYIWVDVILNEIDIAAEVSKDDKVVVAAFSTLEAIENLSFEVYDAYLDRLDSLKPREVNAIYVLYTRTKKIYQLGKFLDEQVRFKSPQDKKSHSFELLLGIDSLYELMQSAIFALNAEKDVKRLSPTIIDESLLQTLDELTKIEN